MKLSIITVCFNDINNLKVTFEFLKLYKQRFDAEIIIVDGGSTDGTKLFLEENNEYISRWVSEPDNGIGDAWNKGFSMSSGEVINFLNAGDRHLPELLEKNIQYFLSNKNRETITYGNTIVEIDGNLEKTLNGDHEKHSIYRGFGFYHPTCFFNREVYERIGKFDPSITIAVDTDWLLRARSQKISFKKIEGITVMDGKGVSNVNRVLAKKQYLSCMKKYGFSPLLCQLYSLREQILGFLRK